MIPADEPIPGCRFQFGDFTLDIREHALTREDRAIGLRPKSFETLAFFVEHHGRLVTKDELLTTLWADVVVTEGALTHCIEEIRYAIGDDPRHPLFIQTVPRVGYRFIAAIRVVPPGMMEKEVFEEDEYTAVKMKFREGLEAGVGTASLAPEGPLVKPEFSRWQRAAFALGTTGFLQFEGLGKDQGFVALLDSLGLLDHGY